MDQSLYFDGQHVLVDDVKNTIETKRQALADRISELAFEVGVVSGLVVTSPSAYTLSVTSGAAYDSNGERITVGSTQTVKFSQNNLNWFLVAAFVEGDETLGTHAFIGNLEPLRTSDSFSLTLVQFPGADDVVLTKIVSIDTGTNVATFDTTQRMSYGLRLGFNRLASAAFTSSTPIIQHVMNVGGGTVSATNPHGQTPEDVGFRADNTQTLHQRYSHGDYLQALSEASISGQVSFNNLAATVTQVQTGEAFICDGLRIETIPTSYTVVQGANPSTIALYVNSAGAVVQRTLAAYTTASRNITGVQPVDVDPDTIAGTYTLTYTVTGGRKYLNLTNGPLIELEAPHDAFQGDRFYHLPTSGGLTVWVDYSALPGGSITDSIAISVPTEWTGHAPLVQIFNRNNGSTLLGYGDEGTFGRVLDQREFGSIGYRHLDGDLKLLLQRMHGELQPNGWAEGGEYSLPGGMAFKIGAGVVYVDGMRFVKPDTTFTMTPSTTTFLVVDEAGDFDDPGVDPASSGFYGVKYARGYRVTTNGGAIIHIVDERVKLTKDDVAINLGVQSMYNAIVQQVPRVIANQGFYGGQTSLVRNRTLLAESKGPSGYPAVRLYMTHWMYTPYGRAANGLKRTVGFEITTNAKWMTDTSGTQGNAWVADTNGSDATLFGYDKDGLYFRNKNREDITSGSASWSDLGMDRSNDDTNPTAGNTLLGGFAGLLLTKLTQPVPPLKLVPMRRLADRSTWSNSPLKMDLSAGRWFFRTSPVQGALSLEGLENASSDSDYVNAFAPKNLTKAWGLFEVTQQVVSSQVITHSRIVAGMNVWEPAPLGDGINKWKISLMTRLTRVKDPRFQFMVSGVVLSFPKSVPIFAANPLYPTCTLMDDGNSTYVMVQGPLYVIAGVTYEQPFSVHFAVLGEQTDEPLPVLQDQSGESTRTLGDPDVGPQQIDAPLKDGDTLVTQEKGVLVDPEFPEAPPFPTQKPPPPPPKVNAKLGPIFGKGRGV